MGLRHILAKTACFPAESCLGQLSRHAVHRTQTTEVTDWQARSFTICKTGFRAQLPGQDTWCASKWPHVLVVVLFHTSHASLFYFFLIMQLLQRERRIDDRERERERESYRRTWSSFMIAHTHRLALIFTSSINIQRHKHPIKIWLAAVFRKYEAPKGAAR